MKVVALILLVGCAVLGLMLWLTKRRAARTIADKDARLRDLTDRNAVLTKYEGIIDVDAEIDRRRHLLFEDEQHIRRELDQLRRHVETDVAQQRSEIAEIKRETREQQAQTLSSASQEAARIIKEANARAEEIAGDAIVAMRDAKQLEATAKAMKNVIKGYGDEYLVPNRSTIDDLAEEYSHKKAGVELRTARERSRQMVKEGLAATCDYAEEHRKETAVHFVVDAFNGKIDSVLSRAKHDNFGKLSQEFDDAFSLVNHSGQAFRNARIQPEYLEARRNELRWTVAANELRLQEQEEQRRIKEQMREEERARREYEKAIREAQKEEQMLQQAMEKARKELAGATEEQRVEYERQLQALEEKLREAEARNQRAVSMAQQTRRGHVYIISNIGSFGQDVFKIGLTRRLEPFDRVRELGDASVPFEFDVHAMIFSEDAPAMENALHETFAEQQINKVNPKKEFFRTNLAGIRKIVQNMGVEAKWTMVAEAREYRETLAVEKAKGKIVPDLPEFEPSSSMGGTERGGAVALREAGSPLQTAADLADQTLEAGDSSQERAGTIAEAETSIDAKATGTSEPTIPCPFCRGPLVADTLQVGMNVCPHCNQTFEAE